MHGSGDTQYSGPGRLAVLERLLPSTVTILDRFQCLGSVRMLTLLYCMMATCLRSHACIMYYNYVSHMHGGLVPVCMRMHNCISDC